MKRIDLHGMTFGRLTVLDYAGNSRWWCRCECGKTCAASSSLMRRGKTVSCGCRNAEIRSGAVNITHGQTGTRLYRIWNSMWARITCENCGSYKNYGGRGISICTEWEKFHPFYEWSMANGYQDRLTIDRLDPNGNYEPANCRWATYTEQLATKRPRHDLKLDMDKARAIRADNRPQTVIAKDYGVTKALISQVKRNLLWKEPEERRSEYHA